ncbi:MAG TPA: hydantoinase/oxoprolinase family protein [Candidatus Limnocylindrales bacterium]|jgi:N-methylhydantoinase A
MRFAVDIGGTFTDLIVEDDDGQLWLRKSSTTPEDPVRGLLDVIEIAARDMGISRRELLRKGEFLIHGTTRAINAILTGTTARTAYLTTRGHRDVLVIREGGREKFNLHEDYPDPYIPRRLTFEITERIGSQGEVVVPLDEASTIDAIRTLADLKVEAVAVCLLWSISNGAHERRVGELLDEHLPGVPYTLSHRLNPCMREYRRGSSAAIDASLKPIMSDYLNNLERRLRDAGFDGRLLMITSGGGVMDLAHVAEAPIHLINSGPAMAPVAGRYYGQKDAAADTVLVADTGGTSYDVGLVRRGMIPFTRETWLGHEWTGHITGFPSIDVRSIGAGGGSIAWVDEGGFLHVGPQSAGALPGPACYGKGGTLPTTTDASLVLGYIDPDYFLGGAMKLHTSRAEQAIDEGVARKLSMTTLEGASAIMQVVTEKMVQLIEQLSLNQGVDPRTAVLVGGGGAAGLNSVALARRLGTSRVVIPETGAALSAFGGLLSLLSAEYSTTFVTSSDEFDYEGANRVLDSLVRQCQEFIDGPGAGAKQSSIHLSAEMRYPTQVWDLEVPLRVTRFSTPEEVEQLRQDLHAAKQEVYGSSNPKSAATIVTWRARVSCPLRESEIGRPRSNGGHRPTDGERSVYFPGFGLVDTLVRYFETLGEGEKLVGPAIIESPMTTVVVDPGATVERTPIGSLLITP